MSQPLSDAAVELLGACRHSLRFSFGTPISYPYAGALPAAGNPPPALFRRIQVASPPPARETAPWPTGLMTDSGPFDPDNPPAKLREVRVQEGTGSLGLPEPEDVVLDWWFSVPRATGTMSFPGSDQDRCFRSVPYWSPVSSSGDAETKQVEYFATHRLTWSKPPKDDWVAVSFDAFWPAERDSADLIVRLGGCDEDCPAA